MSFRRWAVLAVLALAVACTLSAVDGRPAKITSYAVTDDPPQPAPKPAPKPTSCGDYDNKQDCLDGAEEGPCAWCKGDFMPPSCVGVKAAEWIPGTVATCKMPKHTDDPALAAAKGGKGGKGGKKHRHDKKKVPATCMDNKNKHDCTHLASKEGDCAWCQGDFMPGSCLSSMAAKYLPEMVAHCKASKAHRKGDAEVATS